MCKFTIKTNTIISITVIFTVIIRTKGFQTAYLIEHRIINMCDITFGSMNDLKALHMKNKLQTQF